MQRIAVFGCGYVGLVTGACLSHLGNTVVCCDADMTKVRMLQRGEIPFYEPGLDRLVRHGVTERRLSFTASAREALQGAAIAFIAVGTPTGPTGEADLTYVRQAARAIAQDADGPLIVVNKSTVPVETADLVARLVRRHAGADARFCVASNPEFLREGSAVGDFLHPDRVVIGSDDAEAIAALRGLYEPLGAPIIAVDVHTAEMIKYAANAFLAAKISFINEIANLCGAVGADVDGVIAGIGSDARIGPAFLHPGIGFGGSCLPKDVAALAAVARAHAIEPTMLEATLNVNRRQVALCLRALEDALGDLDGRAVAVNGLAFKGGTDDLRESPAVVLVRALLTRGARVRAHDAHALRSARSLFREGVEFAQTPYDCAAGADAFAIASDDRSYASLDWARIARAMSGDLVFDFRNRADGHAVGRAGLRYRGIGRRAHHSLSIKEKDPL